MSSAVVTICIRRHILAQTMATSGIQMIQAPHQNQFPTSPKTRTSMTNAAAARGVGGGVGQADGPPGEAPVAGEIAGGALPAGPPREVQADGEGQAAEGDNNHPVDDRHVLINSGTQYSFPNCRWRKWVRLFARKSDMSIVSLI